MKKIYFCKINSLLQGAQLHQKIGYMNQLHVHQSMLRENWE